MSNVQNKGLKTNSNACTISMCLNCWCRRLCHCFNFHLHFTERLRRKKINEGHCGSISKLISCLLCVLTDIHSEPHHPFKFLINRCSSVSPHQKVELCSRATMCWSSVSFSLLGGWGGCRGVQFLFFSSPAYCVNVCRKHVKKFATCQGGGTAGRPSTLIEYWRSFEFPFPLGCSLRELAQRDKQHVLQD